MKDINLCRVKDSIYLKKIKSKLDISSGDESDGYLIDSKEIEVRKIIDSLKGKNKIIAVISQDNAFNRRAIETLKINYLVSPERGEKKDTLKQRDSGLNHVLAKEAKRKGIKIVIALNELSGLDNGEKSKVLSRIIQNIVICTKASCDIKVVSLSSNQKNVFSRRSCEAIASTLGMSTKQKASCTKF